MLIRFKMSLETTKQVLCGSFQSKFKGLKPFSQEADNERSEEER